jgi:hypothetical protein
MPIPSGSHYTDPSRHHVRLGNGSVVTRATAENIFAQGHGFKNNREYQRAYRSAGFSQYQNRPGYRSARIEANLSGTSTKDFNAAAARYYANEYRNRLDNSPDGPKAKMLEAMGRRTPGSEYRVGESPSVM